MTYPFVIYCWCFRKIATYLAAFFHDTPSVWFHLKRNAPSSSSSGEAGPRRLGFRPFGCLWSRANNVKHTWRTNNKEEFQRLEDLRKARREEVQKKEAERPKRKRTPKARSGAAAPTRSQKTLDGELYTDVFFLH